jgi:aryl-alcohol dehydrogenase-like predicted oxidoreductase
LATSLELLGRERADLLYLCHDAARLPNHDISKWRGIFKSLHGRVERFGLSLYPDQLTESLIEQDDVRVLQLPFNILSPRFPEHLVKRWKGLGKSIFARSVFAQGFLLNDATSETSQGFSEAARVFHQVSDELELPRGELALRWVLSDRGIDGVVVGVSQLGEIPLIGEWAAKGPLGGEEMELIEKKIARFRRPFDLRRLR